MIKSVLLDVNCFFRSIVVQLHGGEEYHIDIRKVLCTHIITNQQQPIVHNSIASHLKQMVKPDILANQVEL